MAELRVEQVGDRWYALECTGDGSPTLRIGESEAAAHVAEPMHNLDGALSESRYIYGDAIKQALSFDAPLSLLSVGLGLGYVEALACGMAEERELCIVSYEADPNLRGAWQRWLRGECSGDLLVEAIDEVARLVANALTIEESVFCNRLRSLYSRNLWRIEGALEATSGCDAQAGVPVPPTNGRLTTAADSQYNFPGERFTCIAFDAFSEGTSPELWRESLLNQLLERNAAPDCVFTTYAAKGVLKRALKAHGFAGITREGFSSKRQSTLAWRGKEN